MEKSTKWHPNARLRRERELRGWSQEYLAEQLETTSTNISRWERGTTFPSPYFRRQLCELFGKSAQELDLMQSERDEDGEPVPQESASEHPSTILIAPPTQLTQITLHDITQEIRTVIEEFSSTVSTALMQERERTINAQFWTIPYRRNPFFTGREQQLTHLWDQLTQRKAATLTQTQAISGLGGIGKTQTAIEYAYRYREQYQTVLWANATARPTLLSDFVKMANLFHLPEKDLPEQEQVVEAVKRWLARHDDWLLILDNVDDIAIVGEVLPREGNGHLLLTTRDQAVACIASRIEMEKMDEEEGTLLLLRRAGVLAPGKLEQASSEDRAGAEAIVRAMDGFPLALDQAGAYLIETACGLVRYLELYQGQRLKLLKRRGRISLDHPESVATTLSLCFQQVEAANPVAADLLRLCALLHPDAIPEEIITIGVADLGPLLKTALDDPFILEEAIGELLRYSLVSRNAEAKTLSIHRLVQAILQDEMDSKTHYQWAERTVRAVSAAFPVVMFSTWNNCERYLHHAYVCADLIDQYGFSFPQAGQLLYRMGWYMQERAHYADAEPFLKRALSTRESLFGPEHPDVANTLTQLARLYRSQGRYAQAERSCRRTLAIREQVLGPEHPDTADTLDHLAQLVYVQARYTEAETLFQRALAIRERVLGPEHPDTADTLDHLAQLIYIQARYAQAETLFQRALAIREQVLGPEHPDTADTLHHLGQLAYVQAQYAGAEPLFQRALTIRERSLGLEHPRTADTLNHLGQLYRSQGQYVRAEPFFQRALAIRENALGSEHASTADTLDNLGQLCQALGQYAQADSIFHRALAIRERALGLEHPRTAVTLDNLGQLYHTLGRYTEAELLFQQALTIREKAFGPAHPYTASTLDNLGQLCQAQGRYTEAKSLFQRTLTIRENVLGLEHPRTIATLNSLRQLYQALGRYAEAEALLQRMLDLKEKGQPERTSTTSVLESDAGPFKAGETRN